jgi:hypothetical protein
MKNSAQNALAADVLVSGFGNGGKSATDLRDGIYTHPSSTEALNEVLGTIVPAESVTPRRRIGASSDQGSLP